MSFRRILVAVDESAFAARAADAGFELARSLGAEMAFIHVVDPSLVSAPESGIAAAELIALAEQDGRRLLAAFGQRAALQPAPLEFIHVGKPHTEIVKAAKDWPADLIVIGSHGRGGVERLLLGSVAEAVITNDFVTMSIATDRVSFSNKADRWHIRTLVLTGGSLAGVILVLSFSVFFAGRNLLHLPLEQLQTLVFVMLVFTGQGNVYLVRERRHFWNSRPSRWLVLSSCADIVVVSVMTTKGILMVAISPALVVGLLAVVLVFLTLVDFFKVWIFRSLGMV